MGKACLSPARFEELPVQRRKQPRLHFCRVPQLMPLGGPDVERLLCQVARVGFFARQAEGKPVERLVIASHHAFKIQPQSHIAASMLRVRTRQMVSNLQPAYAMHSPCTLERN